MKKKIQKHILPYLLIIISCVGFCIPLNIDKAYVGLLLLFVFLPFLIGEDILSKQKWHNLKLFSTTLVGLYLGNIISIGWLGKLLSTWAYLFLIYNSLIPTIFLLL